MMGKITGTVAGTVALGVAMSASVQAGDGMVNVKSQHSVVQTADKLETVLNDKGMTVFARIDHSAGAEKIGKQLRDTQLVLFGNPKVGTPLMLCAQSVAIDLPQKALIWEDAEGTVWLSYNDPAHLAKRHNIQGCDEVLNKVSGALGKFAKAATE
ncbi:DUF302 domain-containing protein [Neptuniibacter sp. QD48_11]|uniref:DUF302 domain-containing protein n=1 Tax=Neptuniibacter sp. QD48_11 TaxID=3398211 RepID=UPI0039F4BA1B